MATKVAKIGFAINIIKNTEKGGAWLASYVRSDSDETYCAAWSNAGAAKRWIKEVTGRKTLKWVTADDKLSFKTTVEVKAE
jgi:hypothetical protein